MVLYKICTVLCMSLVLAYAYLLAIRDSLQIKIDWGHNNLKHKFHDTGLAIRVIVFGVIGIILGSLRYVIDSDEIFAVLAMIKYWMFAIVGFYTVFELKLNKKLDKEPFYVSREKDAAFTDRTIVWLSINLFKNTPEQSAVIVKLGLTSILIILYILYLTVILG